LTLQGLQRAPPPLRGRALPLLLLPARLAALPRRKGRPHLLLQLLARRQVSQRQPVTARLAGLQQAPLDRQQDLRRHQGKAGPPPQPSGRQRDRPQYLAKAALLLRQLDLRLAQQRRSVIARLAGL
jgi:hypothetical protein